MKPQKFKVHNAISGHVEVDGYLVEMKVGGVDFDGFVHRDVRDDRLWMVSCNWNGLAILYNGQQQKTKKAAVEVARKELRSMGSAKALYGLIFGVAAFGLSPHLEEELQERKKLILASVEGREDDG